MSVNLACPSCTAENPKRISEIVKQQPSTSAPTALPSQYNPPKQPWAYLQGFLLGVPINTALMLTMASPQGSEADTAIADIVSSVAFLGVWIGYGAWRTKTHTQKLDQWKKTIASKFLCLKCGHAFET
ncbi:MAG: hypothetical protein HY038_11495 [Nitrospirae bacterium]|nr:hypothetical protein [Nitrospirota bacterium]